MVKEGYDPDLGLRNINYDDRYPHRLTSETMYSLVAGIPGPYRSKNLKPEVTEAIRQYINFLYDPEWKRQMDQWIIRDGITQLRLNNIPVLLQPQILWPWNPKTFVPRHETAKKFLGPWFPDQFIIKDTDCIFDLDSTKAFDYNKDIDPGYHTRPATQVEFKNVLIRYIKECNIEL